MIEPPSNKVITPPLTSVQTNTRKLSKIAHELKAKFPECSPDAILNAAVVLFPYVEKD